MTLRAWVSPPVLERGVTHVWRVPLDNPALDRRPDALAPTELERAGRFFQERDRLRFLRRRTAVRFLAASYLDVPPELLQWEVSPGGKPRIAGRHNLHLNTSHSADIALCAFALDDEIGVDIERVRTDLVWLEIARRFFTNAECDALLALAPSVQMAGFFSIWTQKEAYVKALGQGLSLSPASFASPFVTGSPRLGEVWVQPLELGLDWRAALAVVGRDSSSRVLEWPSD